MAIQGGKRQFMTCRAGAPHS